MNRASFRPASPVSIALLAIALALVVGAAAPVMSPARAAVPRPSAKPAATVAQTIVARPEATLRIDAEYLMPGASLAQLRADRASAVAPLEATLVVRPPVVPVTPVLRASQPSTATPAAPAPATAAPAAASPAAAPPAPASYSQTVWSGTPSYQQETGIWCVPASIQSMLVMTVGHTGSSQQAIYDYGRANMGYAINGPGHDPQAWALSLNAFGGLGYTDATHGSFDAALHDAVLSMRATGKPVGITVHAGTHAWVIVGYSASADPATGDFAVNGVTVVAPFLTIGDPAPGTSFSTDALRGYMTPYWEVERDTRWNGTYVIVKPTW